MLESELEDDLDVANVVKALAMVYSTEWSEEVEKLLFVPEGMGKGASLEKALRLFEMFLPNSLLPLAFVDEESIAVVAMVPLTPGHEAGYVYRYHLQDVVREFQLTLLDIDPFLYVESVDEEISVRQVGLHRILDEIGPAYYKSHVSKERQPRDFVVRPIRLACQNVIIGLAAIAQDSSFDGLSVIAWQTCEVPHLATHEGNRALAALTLCDAFRNGGTMELRFDRPVRVSVRGRLKTYDGHPERRVPASLRRFGRTVGVRLGAEHRNRAAVTPAEARELFLAITPMPSSLRARVDDAVSTRGILPERICFMLLSRVWREVELDYILATSTRAASILAGGADWRNRGARQAEAEVCRTAVMLGMFYRRLNSLDHAVGDDTDEMRVVEDSSRGVSWDVDGETGSVTFMGWDVDQPVPWTHGLNTMALRVVACSVVTEGVQSLVTAAGTEPVAVLVPRDVDPVGLPDEVPVLRCPDRLADLDKAVEANLLESRITRG